MAKAVEYECENKEATGCDGTFEELFNDTEAQPAVLPDETCKKCGGKLVRGLNVKNNCQVWGVHKL